MESLLNNIPPRLLSGGLSIVRRLRDSGHEALFAGGVVRDLLLGRPISDIDVVTSARPDEIEQLFRRTVAVGKQFGVIIVLIDGERYEVATFRHDLGYEDGRHPVGVRFTGPEEDAKRRDFTVNALFLDPVTGEVIDYVGGRQDLQTGIIRTVGDPIQRFGEDRLRLLRAIRFSCRLGFEIEPATYKAIGQLAGKVTEVSWERIRDELLKMLTGPRPEVALDRLSDTGLLKGVLPEVEAMKGVEQPPEYHPEGDVFVHTRLMFELSRERDETLALAILLHDVGKPPTYAVRERIRFDGHAEKGAEIAEGIGRRLRLPNEQLEEVVDLVRNHLRFISVKQMRESTLKRFLRRDNFAKHLELHRLDCLASHGDLGNYEFCRAKLREFGREEMKPRVLLTGDDLIALRMQPGPLFSEILTTLEDLQLEGRIRTKEAAIEWVRSNYLSE